MPPDERRVLFRGTMIRVEEGRWGEKKREVVRHPGAVAVVPRTSDGQVVLVRQMREALDREILEVPAGTRDVDGEPPEQTGRREVAEETGYRATSMERIGSIVSAPGYSDEVVELFAADVEPGGEPEEGIEVVLMPFEEAVTAVRDGRITDAKSVAALLLLASASSGG